MTFYMSNCADKRKLAPCIFILVCILFISSKWFDSLCWNRSLDADLRNLLHTMPNMHQPRNANCDDRRAILEREMVNLTKRSVAPDDSQLLHVLRNHVIDLPSQKMIKMSHRLFQTPQAKVVEQLTHKKQGGFFIECGALDGERSSNTLYLEQTLGWSGLLVEMDPSWYQQLRGKNRKSFSINACISPYQYPTKIDFKESPGGHGKVIKQNGPGKSSGKTSDVVNVYCFPIYSMMLALNQTHIDYFSLDVEGLELDILKTIPFDKLDISILTAEYVHGKGGEQAYTEFMKSKGYRVHSKIDALKPEISFHAADLVFVKDNKIPYH